MYRSTARFGAGALLGAVASFSISFGLVAAVAAVAAVVLVGAAWRSYAAVAGGMMGIGLTWLAFVVLRFSMSLCNGPGCGDGGSYVPLFLAAGLIVLTGVAVGVLGIVRDRAKMTG